MNIALPEWATENVRHRIEKLVALEYNILSFNTLMKRLNGGFIIKEFIRSLFKMEMLIMMFSFFKIHRVVCRFEKPYGCPGQFIAIIGALIILSCTTNCFVIKSTIFTSELV